jgi:hypothetical protein
MVAAESLSSAMSRFDPTILVLDVEGAEADLLCSITEWGRIRAIHLEIHDYLLTTERLEEMHAHLRKHRFQEAPIPIEPVEAHVALFLRQHAAGQS